MADGTHALGELQIIGLLSQDAVAQEVAAHDRNGSPALLTAGMSPLRLDESAAYLGWGERLTACSQHPHIGDVLAYGVSDGRFGIADGRAYLAVRTGSRRTLAELLAVRGSLSTEQVRGLGVALADALVTVHEAGLCHLAVRAEVIFVADDESPMLVGFDAGAPSLARPLASGPLSAPEHRVRHGVLDGVPSLVGPGVDVYGLAATLYQALGGQLSWSELPGSDGVAAPAAGDDRRGGPLAAIPGVPTSMVDTLRRALTARPDHRLTAGQLRDELAGPTRRPRRSPGVADASEQAVAAWTAASLPAVGVPLGPPPTLPAEKDPPPLAVAPVSPGQVRGPAVAEPSPGVGLAPLVGMWRITTDVGEQELMTVDEQGAVTWTGVDEAGPFVATGEALPIGGGVCRLLLNEPAGSAGFYVDLRIENGGLTFLMPEGPADGLVDVSAT